VVSAGTYRLWVHVHASPSGSSALALAVDSGCSISMGGGKLAASTFSWIDHSGATMPVSITLTSGKHMLTVAGKDATVGIDRVLLTSSSCVPVGSGGNCTTTATPVNGPKMPTTSANLGQNLSKSRQHKLSVARKAAYVAASALTAAFIGLILLRYATRPNSVLKHLPFFKGRTPQDLELQPQLSGQPASFVDTRNPINTSAVVSDSPAFGGIRNRRRVALFVLGFGIAGGLISFIALAAPNNSIIIDFSGASTSGQAKIVSNPNAITGKMIQFGVGNSPPVPATQTSHKPSKHSPGSTPVASKANSGSSGTSTSSGSGSASSGSACTNPSWSTGEATGTKSISDTWWVNNDAWSGSHGPQTLYVCNQSSWYAVSNQPNNGGQVETYPDTEYDVGGRGNPSTKTIAQYSSITSTFSEAYPSAGSWDAAYDLWTNNWTNETMIWNQWTGTEDYWGSCAEPGSSQNDCVGPGGAYANSKAATIGGVAYHFLALGSNCSAANESNCEYIFFRDAQVKSGSVNILAVFQWEVANGMAKSTDVPTQLEYGVEVCSTNGNETFPMNGLTFSVN